MATLELYRDDELHTDPPILEGQMNSGNMPEISGVGATSGAGFSVDVPFNTLDEPIRETVWRDVKAVGSKFKHVLYPVQKKSLLKEWDLWGPLILCTFMATVLQGRGAEDKNAPIADGGPAFAEVFVIVWLGSMVVTLNTKLLGGHISFFQSVCVLGYCLLPLSISLIVCRIILLAANPTTTFFIVRSIATLAGLLWASYAAMQFLGDCQPPRRKALAAYPMFLFYFVIAWMVLSFSNV